MFSFVSDRLLSVQMEEIYGGLSVDRDGLPVPAIMGRLCLWRSPRAAATFATYDDFKASLAVSCQETGEPGVLRFTADYDMPSVMYYQVSDGNISHLPRSYTTPPCSAASQIYHLSFSRFLITKMIHYRVFPRSWWGARSTCWSSVTRPSSPRQERGGGRPAPPHQLGVVTATRHGQGSR